MRVDDENERVELAPDEMTKLPDSLASRPDEHPPFSSSAIAPHSSQHGRSTQSSLPHDCVPLSVSNPSQTFKCVSLHIWGPCAAVCSLGLEVPTSHAGHSFLSVSCVGDCVSLGEAHQAEAVLCSFRDCVQLFVSISPSVSSNSCLDTGMLSTPKALSPYRHSWPLTFLSRDGSLETGIPSPWSESSRRLSLDEPRLFCRCRGCV